MFHLLRVYLTDNFKCLNVSYYISMAIVICMATTVSLSIADTQQSLSKISEKEADKIRAKKGKLHLPIITIDDLYEDFSNFVIIDARSNFEFRTLHIKNAFNAPVTNKGFAVTVSKLKEKYPDKHFAFYCNGFVCGKSYTATEIAIDSGFKDIHTFDRGIFAWADKYPELTVHLGHNTLDKNELISALPRSCE